MVSEATAAGRRFARVRVITTPPTDYSRISLAVSRFNLGAGEDIRYLDRRQAEGHDLPNHDYWLFDSKLLVRMHFDESDGRFVAIEFIDDPAEVVQHNYWRDVAQHYAIPRDAFAEQHSIERSAGA